MIDKHYNSPSYKPLYDQIKVLLTQSLIGGEWRPGDMIPSEIDLGFGRYKVSARYCAKSHRCAGD